MKPRNNVLRQWCLTALFFVIGASIAFFLIVFTDPSEQISILQWQRVWQIDESGAEIFGELEEHSLTEGLKGGGVFFLETELVTDVEDAYLSFGTYNNDIALWLDGVLIYESTTQSPYDDSDSHAIARLPKDGTKGTVLMRYRFTGDKETFNMPVVRVTSDRINDSQTYAHANAYSLPAGAYGCMFALLVGVFMIGAAIKKPDWTLALPAVTVAILACRGMSRGMGSAFLPGGVVEFLNWGGFLYLPPLMLLCYLVLHRKGGALRRLAKLTAISAAILVVCYFISILSNSRQWSYVNRLFTDAFTHGSFEKLVYLVTIYLNCACVLIAVIGLMRTYAGIQAEGQALALKNDLLRDNYEEIARGVEATNALRHEMRHNIVAMELLYQKGDMESLGEQLRELSNAQSILPRMQYTGNTLIDAILQHYFSRCEKSQTSFDAKAAVPKDIKIIDGDLICLLMNMLENACEGCEKVEKPEERYIRFRAVVKCGFFAVTCKNSYGGAVRKDREGALLTSKGDTGLNGYGMKHMKAVTDKYNGTLCVRYTENEFEVEAALEDSSEASAVQQPIST